MRTIRLFAIFLFLGILLTACTSEKESEQLKTGEYIEESKGLSRVVIKEDNKISLTLHSASSKLAIGTYEQSGENLIFTDDEDVEYNFLIDGENLILDTEIDTGIKIENEEVYTMEKGMVFIYSEE